MHAERAVAINLESDFGFLQSAVVGIAVLVPAARGDWAAAEAHVAAMSRHAGGAEHGYERSTVALGMSRARHRRGPRRSGGGGGGAGAGARSSRHRDAADEPGFWPWQDLYADALVGVGRVAEADALPGPARGAGARHAGGGRRSPGWPGPGAGSRPPPAARTRAEQAFAAALAATDDLELPFERARIELAAGGFLRRVGQRRRAAELLTAAEQRFAAARRRSRTPSAARRSWPRPGSSRRPGSAGTAPS